MKYKRILLKLSGEALMGDRQYGIDPVRLAEYAEEIKKIHDKGIAIVIGGGNILEELLEPVMEWTVSRGTMGMLATVINGMAARCLRRQRDAYRLQTALK
jgi:uridylate kinase